MKRSECQLFMAWAIDERDYLNREIDRLKNISLGVETSLRIVIQGTTDERLGRRYSRRRIKTPA